MISNVTKCSILRWIHIIFSIPKLGYIYSPFEEIPNYAHAVRFISFLYLSFRDCGCGKVTVPKVIKRLRFRASTFFRQLITLTAKGNGYFAFQQYVDNPLGFDAFAGGWLSHQWRAHRA